MIDSHTHLDLCEPPDEQLVAEALAAAERFPAVYAAVGRHPNSATGFGQADLAELRELAAHPRCLAIGETGLDFYRDHASPQDQRRAFAAHIALARDTAKPLVIHSRAAERPTLDQLAEEAHGVSVIMHCFSMPAHLAECVSRGYMLSFAGNVTYKSAHDLAASAREAPAERLLVETDAPYLTPQAVRKQRNQPAFVIHTARAIAELRGLSLDELDSLLEANAARVFGW